MIKRLLPLILFTLIIAFSFVQSNMAESQFGGVLVYPNVVELDFTNSKRMFVSKSIKVENPTNKPFRVRAYVEGWNLNEYGGIVFLHEPDKHSLNKHLKFNPKEFDLAPGQEQLVRLTAKLPKDAEGEFRSLIFFETVNPKKEILSKNNDKVNINVQFKTRYGVAVYAYKGDVSKNAELKDFKYKNSDGNGYLTATLKNDGNIHCNVEGDLTLISEENENNVLTSQLARYTILPNNTQKYRILIPDNLNSGNYKAILNLNYKDIDQKVQVLGAETKIKYIAEKPVSDLKLPNPVTEKKIEKNPENIAKPIDMQSEINLEE